jgi:hypothetical protein
LSVRRLRSHNRKIAQPQDSKIAEECAELVITKKKETGTNLFGWSQNIKRIMRTRQKSPETKMRDISPTMDEPSATFVQIKRSPYVNNRLRGYRDPDKYRR